MKLEVFVGSNVDKLTETLSICRCHVNRSFATLSRLLWQGPPTDSDTASISSTCLTFARCTIAYDTNIVRFSCQSCNFNARSERHDAVGKSGFCQPPRRHFWGRRIGYRRQVASAWSGPKDVGRRAEALSIERLPVMLPSCGGRCESP